MGMVVPRPAIRKGQARLIHMRLKRHAALMEDGMSSKEAYDQVLRELPSVEAARKEAKR
jgi:hypothetical protein